MGSKPAVLMTIAFWCLMLGMRASAAQAAPDTVLEYERGLMPTEVVDFDAMRQSVRPFKRTAIDAQLPWLPKVTGPLQTFSCAPLA
jgi:hypothetical protein